MNLKPKGAPIEKLVEFQETMKKIVRIMLWIAGSIISLIVGYFIFVALVISDTITFTEKTQSFELPAGKILNIYRTSKWEYSDCSFELRESRKGRVLIPKRHFDDTSHTTYKFGTNESTPVHRTTYVALIGKKSGIVGLVGAEDLNQVRLLIDLENSRFSASSWFQTDEEKKLGSALLAALKWDFPDLDRKPEDLYSVRRYDLEKFRERMVRVDAASKLGNTFSLVLDFSYWEPTSIVTNKDGTIQVEIIGEPSHTRLGPIHDATITNGFILTVSNGIVIGKRYVSTNSY